MLYRNNKQYFSSNEITCNCGCGCSQLAEGVGEKLLDLRIELDEPMYLSSACRCAKYNEAEGGHARSLHVCDFPVHDTGGTAAFDVLSQDVCYNARLIKLALIHGWSIGVNKQFIHIDMRAWVGMDQAVFTY